MKVFQSGHPRAFINYGIEHHCNKISFTAKDVSKSESIEGKNCDEIREIFNSFISTAANSVSAGAAVRYNLTVNLLVGEEVVAQGIWTIISAKPEELRTSEAFFRAMKGSEG